MITLVAYVAVALLQGWLMQTAVAITGDPAPRFGKALWAGIFTFFTYHLTSFFWGSTIGWFMKFFVGEWLAGTIGIALALLFSALVVKRRLSFAFGHALVITALHLVFSSGAQWVVGRVLSLVAG
ncbi:MAG: hypothetical protein AAF211_21005 [Myxococcota bacterium]